MESHKDIESRLNNVSIKPLSEEEKGIMWSKIEKGIAEPIKSPFWSAIASPFSALRLQTSVAVALMVAVLFGTTSITFAYADNSKPGDLLFPISALKEKIVISLTPTQNQNEVRLQYAEKRIEQGNEFLTALNTTATTSASTRVLEDKIATSSTPMAPIYYGKATSSPAVVGDAVGHLSATIAYLQGVKADMILGGNTSGAQTIQTAIDKILEQVNIAGNQNAVVVAKVQEHKNQFNVVVSTKNASTTTTTNLAVNTKKDTQKVTITEKENRPVVITEKKNEDNHGDNNESKKNGKNERDEEKGNNKKENNNNNKNVKEGFFGWFGNNKKSNVCHNGKTINVSNSAVMDHLKHGDSAGVCRSTTNTNPSDITAPVVSSVSTSVTSTTAKITWNTNENATAVFWYGTTTPLLNSTVLSTLRTNQEVNLSSLESNKAYSFAIVAKDAVGNVSTTTGSFTTAVIPDTTPPTLSDITIATTTNSATITWKTNENANGKIYYGTVTPVVLATSQNTKMETAKTTDHSFFLTGLESNKTYYFVLEGVDIAGNTGINTEKQFTTGS